MSKQVLFTNHQIAELATEVVNTIYEDRGIPSTRTPILVAGVPRGGIPAAYAVAAADRQRNIVVVDDPKDATYLIDDIIDSGTTRDAWSEKYGGRPFLALVDKSSSRWRDYRDSWMVFPWEGGIDGSIEDNIIRLLQFVGEDPTRGGLTETPARVAKAWAFWTSGYAQKPEDVLKTFEDGANGVDEMVVLRAPVYSHCEHHMAAIFGEAIISYIPDGRIVGLSKMSRLVNVFARRLQVQERLTNQIADALMEHLKPKGVGVLISARHMCMESRGICVHNGKPTTTSALRGVIKSKPEARAEFMALAR